MDVNKYRHVFPTWEVYPRIHYFQRRFADLHPRFKKLTNAIPERFRDASLMHNVDKLDRSLGKPLHVTVMGARNMAPSDFVVSTNALEQQPEIPFPSTAGIHICIYHTSDSRDTDESGLEVIGTTLKNVSETAHQMCSDLCYLFVVCETAGNESPDDTARFCANIQKEIECRLDICQYPVYVLAKPTENKLQKTISDVLEKDIIQIFQDIFVYLDTFLRKDNRCEREKIIVLESETVVNEIIGFLGNGPALADIRFHAKQDSFMNLVLESLCRKILCATVSPIAAKYNLPDSICHGLLEEISFDKDLAISVTPNTRYHLQKLEKYTESFEECAKRSENQYTRDKSKSHKFDFILYQLKKDMQSTVESAEKKFSSMERISTVMRKMCFEISGYLRQTHVSSTDVNGEARAYELPSRYVSDELRKEILGVKGVQGMGTLYGQLEIHLRKDLSQAVQDTKKALEDLLCKHQFHHPYLVKIIDENAKKLTNCLYEQGDKLASTCPDNMDENREGTLGCFAKDTNGHLYCFTCAHVVDPHNRKKHDVFVYRGKDRKRFGVSTPQMTLYSGEENLPLIDFAAVRIENDGNVISSCNCCMRDELGKPKPVGISIETSHQLVGCDVYKYGAKTGLTKGVIASVDYSCSGEKAKEYLIIIEPPPTVDTDDMLGDTKTDSPSSSQEQISSNEKVESDDSGFGSLLNISSDENNLSSGSMMEKDGHLSLQVTSLVESFTCNKNTKEGEIDASVCVPRPETLDTVQPRNCETMLSSNLHKYSNVTATDTAKCAPEIFADEGDSGAIVFMNDLKNNTIVVVSMIIAGNFKLKVPEGQSSDVAKCFSFSLNKALTQLEQKCNTSFSLNP